MKQINLVVGGTYQGIYNKELFRLVNVQGDEVEVKNISIDSEPRKVPLKIFLDGYEEYLQEV